MSNHRLTIQNVTVSYGQVPAVQNLNVELRCGCCVGLLGPNGAGKSTLLKAIAGLVTVQSGKIELHGHEPRRARSIAYLPQRGVIDWDFPITVRGMVAMGRFRLTGLKDLSTLLPHLPETGRVRISVVRGDEVRTGVLEFGTGD